MKWRRKPYGGVSWSEQAPETPFTIGQYHDVQISLTEKQQQEHILVVGPTGTGKSSGLIIPNILSELGSRQVMAIDPKGELLDKTVGALAERHRISVFMPTNPEQSDCYNPLAYVRGGNYAVDDADDIATCWVENTGESKGEPFWDNAAKLLITTVILHVKAVNPAAPFYEVTDTLARLNLKDLRIVLSESPSELVRARAGSFFKGLMDNTELAGAVQVDLPTRFQRMESEPLRQVTSRHEIDFSSMSGQPGALFLCVPAYDAQRLQPVSALFLMHLFRAWSQDQYHSKVAYLDEFANAGKIPNMNRYVSMLRSSQSALIMAIQNHKQLEGLYGEQITDTILSNCTTHLVLPGAGQHECEYYSRRAGMQTVVSHGFSRNDSGGGLFGGQSSYGYSQSQTQRPLITPDEIRRMPTGYLLMVSGNADPMIIRTTPWYRHPWLSSRCALPYTRPNRLVLPPPPLPPMLPALPSGRAMPPVQIMEVSRQLAPGPQQRLLRGPQTSQQTSASDDAWWDAPTGDLGPWPDE